jgi:amidase
MISVDDMRHDFESYLDALEYKPIKDLPALIEFNRQHADVELPPG